MDLQKIEKSLKQMKGVFIFVGVINVLYGLYLLSYGSFFWAVVDGAIGYFAIKGYLALKDGIYNEETYTSVRYASIALLIIFPIFTFFGWSYLNKLKKDDMKQQFGLGAPAAVGAVPPTT